ncbi:unnamed protein product [Fusarium graminearum]|uniref:Chromosome 4, complete genome n=2 Tax=Gibberella zeae TaxID=5518 RepID=A0A098DU06_GIBZE|nr:unnamed protein product [Fusarium graminearum]CAF3642798.1 unnamed protein product [Fusarium graminearum]CAG1972074.1 unnamed protein product [Fusarium graminearum]CAG1975393.1 unnamed protein product [Fusarium graminearum]CEF84308.1 unnamed protein product [Fusarium graminearum]
MPRAMAGPSCHKGATFFDTARQAAIVFEFRIRSYSCTTRLPANRSVAFAVVIRIPGNVFLILTTTERYSCLSSSRRNTEHTVIKYGDLCWFEGVITEAMLVIFVEAFEPSAELWV